MAEGDYKYDKSGNISHFKHKNRSGEVAYYPVDAPEGTLDRMKETFDAGALNAPELEKARKAAKAKRDGSY